MSESPTEKLTHLARTRRLASELHRLRQIEQNYSKLVRLVREYERSYKTSGATSVNSVISARRAMIAALPDKEQDDDHK